MKRVLLNTLRVTTSDKI